jgi:prevent-host-death family protein
MTMSEHQDPEMYNTEGVDSVATITELRSDTSDLIEHVRNTKNGVLIQKNNEPHAVLISWETYKTIKEKVDLNEL